MTSAKLLHHRLHSQRLAATNFEDPAEPVRWLGAVQAQDYLGSLWGIGLRTGHATQKIVEQAIANRSIVRTWPMRGTLHFVAAEDVRWMLELLTPRVVAGSAARLEREYGLDEKELWRAREAVARALEGGRRLTRPETYRALEKGRVRTAAGRGLQIVGRLAHDGLICFGPREGKQPTLVLLEEWIPNARRLGRNEALAELARRYFTGHGPATVHDFAWWSGLSLADARSGVAMVNRDLVSRDVAGRQYWASTVAPRTRPTSRAYLLPAFDEYTVAYRDRSSLIGIADSRHAGADDIFQPTIVVNGRVVGTWTRQIDQGSVAFGLKPFTRLGPTARRAVAAAARRYAAFLG